MIAIVMLLSFPLTLLVNILNYISNGHALGGLGLILAFLGVMFELFS